MTANQKQYNKEVNNHSEYRISVSEFTEWLTDNGMKESFTQMVQDKDLDEYDVALDFSIPVSMVKVLQKKLA